MYEQHWRYMKRIMELGDGQSSVCTIQYQSQSRVSYKGM
jgi:hypothetical protein